jgi:hypothetical protein
MQSVTEDMATHIEWAYIKATPVEGLSVRGGRMSLPNFLVSDSRRVGYANTSLRPANEVYGVDLLNGGLTGLDISYRMPLGGNGLTITALGGTSSVALAGTTSDVKNVRGINALWEGDGYSLRMGRIEGEPDLSANPGGVASDVYTFTGIGANVDIHDVVLQAEYVNRRSANLGVILDVDGWYILGGYRFGNLLPYLQLAMSSPANGSIAAMQKSTAAGVRWDAFSSAALKFQVERVDTFGTTGYSFATPSLGFGANAPVAQPVNVFSVAVDFVF